MQWKPVRIGAGGYLVGMDIAPDGTRVVRADTYGAYVWSGTEWSQLVTSTSMPASDIELGKAAGVYEIRIAPSDSNRFYMMYLGAVYRSNNKGRVWSKTAFVPVTGSDANDNFRSNGGKMAVDPANPDVVYAGTTNDGVWVTSNGGTSWSKVTAIPPGTNGKGGMTGIAFDATSGQMGGKTRTIYVGSWDNGVYRSGDAGATWARLTGGPLNVENAITSGGAYFAADNLVLWKYSGSAWSSLTTANGQGLHSVAIDPTNPSRIIIGASGGALNQSTDNGVTWTGWIFGAAGNFVTRVAADIPWLATTKEDFMSNGNMIFDPTVSNTLLFAEGIGVWQTSLPVNATWMNGPTWNSKSAGIEQLVPDQILSPPGGKPLVASWDRPIFYVADPDTFPSMHGPDTQNAIVMGWAVDYASSDPSYIAGVFNFWGVERSAYSTDYGRTWTQFPSKPADVVSSLSKIGGCIAASTPTNLVWIPSNGDQPYYTKNGGTSWTAVNPPGTTATDNGWGFAYYLTRHIVAADRVTPGTFYAYHAPNGLYRSTDGGATWTRVYTGEITPFSGYNAKLRAMPGVAGTLYFTGGPQSGDSLGNPVNEPFMVSTNGGATWTAVPNVLEVYDFGFGKAKAGRSNPALYIAGWVSGQYGIWESDDGSSWTRMGIWPLNSLDAIKAVSGDMNVYGRVYVGFSGSGYAYADLVP